MRGSTYHFRVFSRTDGTMACPTDGSVVGHCSTPVSVSYDVPPSTSESLPARPGRVTVDTVGASADGIFEISWTPPATSAEPIAKYAIERKERLASCGTAEWELVTDAATASPYEDGVHANRCYNYRVGSIGTNGLSSEEFRGAREAETNDVNILSAKAKVEIEAAEAEGPTSVKVTWELPVIAIKDHGGFLVHFRSDSGDFDSGDPITNTTATEAVITGLAPATAYDFKVTVIPDADGVDSDVVQATTEAAPPAPPTNVGVEVDTGTDVTVTWTAPVPENTDIVDYEVQRKTGADGTWALVETVTHATDPHSLIHTGLEYGSTYFYRVFSRTEATACPLDGTTVIHCSTPAPSAAGVEYTAPALVTPVVTGVTVTFDDATSEAVITWDAITDDSPDPITATIEIEWCGDADATCADVDTNFSDVGTPAAITTTEVRHTHADHTDGSIHTYRVRVLWVGSGSTFEGLWAKAQLLIGNPLVPPPPVVTGLDVIKEGDPFQIVISWTETDGGLHGNLDPMIEIGWCPKLSTACVDADFLDSGVGNLGTHAITTDSHTQPKQASHTDDSHHTYRVRVVWKDGATVEHKGGWAEKPFVIRGPPPDPPTNVVLAADVANDQNVTVTWDAPATTTNISFYNLQRKTGADGTWALVKAVAATDPHSFSDTGLEYSLTYFYRVFSRKASPVSCPHATQCSEPALSDPQSYTVPDDPSAVARPGSVTASAGTGTLVVTWTAPTDDAGIVKYAIARKTGDGDWETLETTADAATLTYDDATVFANRTYIYRVQSLDVDAKGSAWTESTPHQIDKAKPGNVTLSEVASTSVTVTWELPVFAVEGHFGFEVLVKAGGDTEFASNTVVRNTEATSAVAIDLMEATAYEFKVGILPSTDGENSESASSTTLSKADDPKPAPPKLQHTLNGNTVGLVWDAPTHTGSGSLKEYVILLSSTKPPTNEINRRFLIMRCLPIRILLTMR